MTHFDILNALDPAIISHFLETGESKGIPPETQEWLREISAALEIYETDRNILSAARELRKRITAKSGKKISLRTCQERIYAALEYFHVDNTVSDKVWYIDFANKYEDMSAEAQAAGQFKAAYQLQKAAEECREKSSVAASLDVQFIPVFLISPDTKLIDYGFETQKLKEIARKNNDGYYLGLINGLPIDKAEKKRLLTDANIADTDYQEIESD